MVGLNRGIFYLHYKDVFDLLEETEAELQDEFNQPVLEHDAMDLRQRPTVIFNEIYLLVYENADLIEILLGEDGDLSFVSHLKRFTRGKCLKDWMGVFRTGNPAVFDALFSYIASSCVRLVQYQPQTGLKGTLQQMARLTERIITQRIEVLEVGPYAQGRLEFELSFIL